LHRRREERRAPLGGRIGEDPLWVHDEEPGCGRRCGAHGVHSTAAQAPSSCRRILPRRANQVTAKPSTSASSTPMFEYAQFPSQYEPAGSATKVPRPSGSSRSPCQLVHGAAWVKELTTRPQPSTEPTGRVTSEGQSTAP